MLDGNGTRLTVLKLMELIAGLFLILFQTGEEALFVVAASQLFSLAIPPRQHSPLGGILVGGFIGQIQIKLHALGHGLG